MVCREGAEARTKEKPMQGKLTKLRLAIKRNHGSLVCISLNMLRE